MSKRYTNYKQKELVWRPKTKNPAVASSSNHPPPPPPPPSRVELPKRYTIQKQKKFVWRPKQNPPPPPPPWVELPRDITANILQRLGTIDVLQTALTVCTTWRSVCLDPAMWRVISIPDHLDFLPLEDMCRYAVDLSQGQLEDISIDGFGTDDLLLHIAQRANQLRRLRLISCYEVSTECFCKAATKFPLLQELQIHFSSISSEGIKVVGRACPLLKSFSFDKCQDISSIEFDDQALAIAENMHGLCHLALIGNKMTNKGVQAILDGCPHLESLDLRKCFNVTLEGDLGKRCSERIKNLRRPNDSIKDYEFYDEYLDEDEGDDDYHGFYLSDESDELPPNGYYYDFDYDDYVAYDDYTNPFSHEYLDPDDIPWEWFM